MKAGTVLLAGGGRTTEAMVQAFVAAAGGSDAPFAILAYTQSDPKAGGQRSQDYFRELGGRGAQAYSTLDPNELKAALANVQGVWIPGGDQNRFTKTFPESSGVWQAIADVYRRGGVVGGTSAGASLMGGWMPTGAETDKEGLQMGAYPIALGLGALPKAIVDQHFLKRNRLIRLLASILQSPDLTGIGVDEDAWATYQGGVLKAGVGQVIVVRAQSKPRHHEGLLACGDIRMHALAPGDTLRLKLT